MFTAVLLSRKAVSLRSIVLAALVVLGLRPEAVLSPGFQMSFAATLALVVVFGALANWRIWPSAPKSLKYLGGSILSAAVAGLATAPFAAAHFNMLPHYGIVANVLAVPIMGVIVMPGAILASVLAPVGAEALGLWVMHQGLSAILAIAHWVSGFDESVSRVPSPPAWAPGIIALGGVILFFWVGRLRLIGAGVMAATIVIWGLTPRPDILISDDAKLVGVVQSGTRVLNRSKGAGFAARVWLENDGSAKSQYEAFGRLGEKINVSKTDVTTPEICSARVRVIEGWVDDPACDVFDLNHLKRTGALAGYNRADGLGYDWQTTRAVVGRRLWNDWQIRRRGTP